MSQTIIMPSLGAGIEEGTLLNWIKQPGDIIASGDVIAEVEIDKATVEIPANVGGTILKLTGEPGQMLKVGAVIGEVGAAGETTSPPVSESKGAPAPTGNSPPPAAPAPSDTSGQPAAPAPAAQAPAAPDQTEDDHFPDGIKASPLARNMAAEKGIDLHLVVGTGTGGRITKSDVENFKPGTQAAPAAPVPAASAPAAAAPRPATFGQLPTGDDIEIIDVSRMRSRIAARMTDSKQQIPHFYVTAEIDVNALLDLRKQLNADLDDDHKISVNDLVVKATALTLRA